MSPLRLNGSTSGYSELEAPAVAGDKTFVLPDGYGTNGQFLQTNGSGVLSWANGVNVQEFTANGTWTKPSSGTVALIRCWGGGGSGARGTNAGGGGGGACVERWVKLTDLGVTEAVTIAAGGASRATNGDGFVGGDTSFGSHVTAYGGGRGDDISTTYGGGGGGSLSAGGTTGDAGTGHSFITTGGNPNGDWGGAIGGGGNGGAGFNATWGGAGGGGRNSATSRAGGISLNGGNGSASNTGDPGGFPGGGSGGVATGSTGAGGDGYCIVIVY